MSSDPELLYISDHEISKQKDLIIRI